ncbi:MAG: Holliday junction resolvase RuvX [Coriobacteriales bacterium]|jgi:putative Holliday junction resolvase|nr:Holliday junction resolvase RuvX [Coriobacteriales bacterium]
MRILALDIGEKRTGVAISDASGRVASPVDVLDTVDVLAQAPRFRRVIEDYEPGLLLCGVPLSLDGEANMQALRTQALAQQIAQQLGLPLAFQDERLSSQEARRILRESGHSERSMRGKVDMIAASLFLQTYLDEQAKRVQAKRDSD